MEAEGADCPAEGDDGRKSAANIQPTESVKRREKRWREGSESARRVLSAAPTREMDWASLTGASYGKSAGGEPSLRDRPLANLERHAGNPAGVVGEIGLSYYGAAMQRASNILAAGQARAILTTLALGSDWPFTAPSFELWLEA